MVCYSHYSAEEVGMIPGELIGNLGDTHLYLII